MNKRKLICQISICLILAAFAFLGSKTENQLIASYFDMAKEQIMYQVSLADIKEWGSEAAAALTDAPAKVVAVVLEANKTSKYSAPIDEKSTEKIKHVHAVAGGMVLASGKSEELGLYLKIRHEDGISIYGNLSDLNVVESQRVQRSEIIGSYDTTCGKEFYYQFDEEL